MKIICKNESPTTPSPPGFQACWDAVGSQMSKLSINSKQHTKMKYTIDLTQSVSYLKLGKAHKAKLIVIGHTGDPTKGSYQCFASKEDKALGMPVFHGPIGKKTFAKYMATPVDQRVNLMKKIRFAPSEQDPNVWVGYLMEFTSLKDEASLDC